MAGKPAASSVSARAGLQQATEATEAHQSCLDKLRKVASMRAALALPRADRVLKRHRLRPLAGCGAISEV